MSSSWSAELAHAGGGRLTPPEPKPTQWHCPTPGCDRKKSSEARPLCPQHTMIDMHTKGRGKNCPNCP